MALIHTQEFIFIHALIVRMEMVNMVGKEEVMFAGYPLTHIKRRETSHPNSHYETDSEIVGTVSLS
jgi:hypothetical protein